ncbi:hypothetical protein DUNSADRAFT_5237 [Dunaliella salina]|uniref:Uncharacterized protein n=1 Tax=Dunaliella salina TaxID=3046 RepID=A0ABQ7GQM0_DUNSA|nr:hypothetical protein DUNSADRAFT_5237 [Dunaliella salina]|eukprot:KAF5836906.1 hypothetical protein DUNSADRAFT_5237 [Dunaliella salina]
MPSSFARFGEKMKQTLNPLDLGAPKDWKPTSNARNQASLAEARAFAQVVKRMLKDFTAMQKASDASFTTTRAALAAKAPRTVDPEAGSKSERQTIGGGMDMRKIEDGASHLRLNIQSQVIKPLASWLGAYRSTKAKMAKLEEMRLDVDAKRRDFLSHAEKLQKASDKEKSSLEEKKRTAEEKANRLFTTYKTEEIEVFKALELLCKDSVAAKAYSKAVLEVMQGAFSIASEAFYGQDTSEAAPNPFGDAPQWYTSAWQSAPSEHINYDSDN